MSRLFDLSESGYFYTRLQNPTNDTVAAKICELEGGAAAMLTRPARRRTSSRCSTSATTATTSSPPPPSYGRTFNLINVTMRKWASNARS